MFYSNRGFYCCAWKAHARCRASRRSSSTSTTSPTPWALAVNPSETMGAASRPRSPCPTRKWCCLSAMRYVPSEPPSWSRLRRTVQPSSQSSWLQIARPKPGKRLCKTSGRIAFTALAWPPTGASACKPAPRLRGKRGAGCVTSSMRVKPC